MFLIIFLLEYNCIVNSLLTFICIHSYSCAEKLPEEKKFFKTKEFHYIIFDEAHKLKNMTSQAFETFSNFNVHILHLLSK